VPINQQDVRNAWYDWLAKQHWDWFATLTFKDAVHPEQAHKRWCRWLSALGSHGRPVGWARVIEHQKRGVLHYHAVISGVDRANRLSAKRRWENVGHGFARIWPCESDRALRYLVKHLGRGAEVDIDSSSRPDAPTLSELAPDQSKVPGDQQSEGQIPHVSQQSCREAGPERKEAEPAATILKPPRSLTMAPVRSDSSRLVATDLASALLEIERHIGASSTEPLPDLVGALERLKTLALARAITSRTSANIEPPSVDSVEELRHLTPRQVAELLNVKETYVQELCRSRQMIAVKQGKYWMIPLVELRKWLARGRPGIDARPGESLRWQDGQSTPDQHHPARPKGTKSGTSGARLSRNQGSHVISSQQGQNMRERELPVAPEASAISLQGP
jgi:excisionase family DNA binding protein